MPLTKIFQWTKDQNDKIKGLGKQITNNNNKTFRIMKKNYFMLAAATMMLAACAETDLVNEIAVEETPQAIGFETFADKVTRAVTDIKDQSGNVTQSNTTKLESYHSSFGVWAYKTTTTTTNVMPNFKVQTTDQGNTWTYAAVNNQPLKYWDKNAKYSFYAYAPYVADGVSETSGVISIENGEYAANENLQTTLSTTLNSSKFSGIGEASSEASTDWMIAAQITEYDTYANPVNEVFSHIMSKIVVKLISTVPNTTINSVSVNNVYGSGEYNGSTWVPAGNAKSINGTIPNGETSVGTLVTASTAYYVMEYLLIPSTQAPTFSINYTVNGDTYTVTDKEITGITKFDANTKYELTVTIDLTAIEFSATASDFTSSGTGSATIY